MSKQNATAVYCDMLLEPLTRRIQNARSQFGNRAKLAVHRNISTAAVIAGQSRGGRASAPCTGALVASGVTADGASAVLKPDQPVAAGRVWCGHCLNAPTNVHADGVRAKEGDCQRLCEW